MLLYFMMLLHHRITSIFFFCRFNLSLPRRGLWIFSSVRVCTSFLFANGFQDRMLGAEHPRPSAGLLYVCPNHLFWWKGGADWHAEMKNAKRENTHILLIICPFCCGRFTDQPSSSTNRTLLIFWARSRRSSWVCSPLWRRRWSPTAP